MGRPLIRRACAFVFFAAMRLATLACLVAIILPARTALAADAPVTGAWTVHGRVSPFSFDLTCRFAQSGEAISGVCYDGGAGRPHPLTHGEISGSRIRWTYRSSYLFKTFEAAYSGTVAGNSIKGVVTAPGRQGDFTAERQP
jgi:hypothetical protein